MSRSNAQSDVEEAANRPQVPTPSVPFFVPPESADEGLQFATFLSDLQRLAIHEGASRSDLHDYIAHLSEEPAEKLAPETWEYGNLGGTDLTVTVEYTTSDPEITATTPGREVYMGPLSAFNPVTATRRALLTLIGTRSAQLDASVTELVDYYGTARDGGPSTSPHVNEVGEIDDLEVWSTYRERSRETIRQNARAAEKSVTPESLIFGHQIDWDEKADVLGSGLSFGSMNSPLTLDTVSALDSHDFLADEVGPPEDDTAPPLDDLIDLMQDIERLSSDVEVRATGALYPPDANGSRVRLSGLYVRVLDREADALPSNVAALLTQLDHPEGEDPAYSKNITYRW